MTVIRGTGRGQGRGSTGEIDPRHPPPPYGGPSTGKPNRGGPPAGGGTGGTVTPPPPAPGPLAGLDPGLQAVLYAGIPTPPVAPFLTPEQMTALSQAYRDYNISVGDLDYQLGIQNIDTSYQKGQSDRKAVMDTEAANDNAVRRGIFQSSIRDSDLADIQATNATAKGRLDDLLAAATIHTDTQERALKGALDDMRQNYNVLAATNAAEVGKDQNPWLVEPNKDFAPTPPPGSSTGGPSVTSKPGTTTYQGPDGTTTVTGTGTGQGSGSTTPVSGQVAGQGGGRTITGTSSGQGYGSASAHARVAAGVWTPSRSVGRRRGR
jgi:hypothetical protein